MVDTIVNKGLTSSLLKNKYTNISLEPNNYLKIQVQAENDLSKSLYGIIDKNGVEVIPPNCSEIRTIISNNLIRWIAIIGKKMCVYREDGARIVPLIFDKIELYNSSFICKVINYEYKPTCRGEELPTKYVFEYNLDGEQILYFDNGKAQIDIPAEYDVANYAGMGLIRVMKEGKWGLINCLKDIVLIPCFSYIGFFEESFAIVGNKTTDEPEYFLEEVEMNRMKLGLINCLGKIALPVENDRIEKWNNGYYRIEKNEKFDVYSPNLKNMICQNKWKCDIQDGRYLLVDDESKKDYGFSLLDFCGKEIITAEKLGFCSKVETIGDDFILVEYKYPDWRNVAVFSSQGDIIYKNYPCCEINYIGNGLFKVCDTEFYDFYNQREIFNIVNLQGNHLYSSNFKEIEVRKDGKISIQSKRGFGIADSSGKIIAHPRYDNRLYFENGFAKLSEALKIDETGQIFARNDAGTFFTLPSRFYWGTKFISGISLVRNLQDKVGAITEQGHIIINDDCERISILSNDTLLVKRNNLFSVYNQNGECQLPPIFSNIVYIKENRYKVSWNTLCVDNGGTFDFKNASLDEKRTYSSLSKMETSLFSRSAVCDSFGQIMNDKNYLIIGKYKNSYARCYRQIDIENNKPILKQVGVIDKDGNTLIPPIYDWILLNSSDFALVRTGRFLGIANLLTKKVQMIDNLIIKRYTGPDLYGRVIYNETGARIYHREEDSFDGTNGVFSMEGVLIKPGQFKEFEYMTPELIKVRDKNNKYGVINANGELIHFPKFSFISSFYEEYASVCIGGCETEYNGHRFHSGGKWGIIDRYGNYIKECVFDKEQQLPECNFFDKVASIQEQLVLATLSTPIRQHYSRCFDEDYIDNDNLDGDKYGEYNGYDDQTIDEAFDGDPSLTWNID